MLSTLSWEQTSGDVGAKGNKAEERGTEGSRAHGQGPAGIGGEWEDALLPDSGAEIGIHGCIRGPVSGNDDLLGEPDGKTEGDERP